MTPDFSKNLLRPTTPHFGPSAFLTQEKKKAGPVSKKGNARAPKKTPAFPDPHSIDNKALQQFYKTPAGLTLTLHLKKCLQRHCAPHQTLLRMDSDLCPSSIFSALTPENITYFAPQTTLPSQKAPHLKNFPGQNTLPTNPRFHCIFLAHCLKHHPSPTAFLDHMWSLLRPEGHLIFFLGEPTKKTPHPLQDLLPGKALRSQIQDWHNKHHQKPTKKNVLCLRPFNNHAFRRASVLCENVAGPWLPQGLFSLWIFQKERGEEPCLADLATPPAPSLMCASS